MWLEDNRLHMKINIIPEEPKNWLSHNNKGYFDVYTKARKNNREAHSAVKKFMANALHI